MLPEYTLLHRATVNIRFTSSLTHHDENLIAPVLINALTSILNMLPIAYVIRIDTSDSNVYQHSRPMAEVTTGEAPSSSAPAVVVNYAGPAGV